ncbi:MAG: integrase [Alphaproteobacteria bacterium]
MIGSIRRDCLDHLIVLSEAHLHRTLSSYLSHYLWFLTHLSLGKDTPEPRPIQSPSDGGRIVAFPQVCGLHHRHD